MLLDVHMIIVPSDKAELLGRCLDSLSLEPIQLHIVDGIVGDLGEGRVKAFKRGENKYVGWVDPDDYIVPGAFAECLAYLTNHPDVDGVYMFEEVESNGHIIGVAKYPHHMTVVKREIVELLFDKIRNSYPPERPINELPTLHCIPKVGYRYCIRPDSMCRSSVHRHFP